MINFKILVATPSDRLPIYRMLELYQHDLSDIWDQDLDAHGEYGYPLDKFWTNPICTPFVFLVDGKYAGCALVNRTCHLDGDDCAGMSLVATGWAALSVKFSAMMLRSNVSDRFHARVVAFLCAWVPLRCGPSRYRWPAIRSYSCDPQRKLAWMELHYCDKIVTDYYLLIYSDHNFEHFSKKSTGR